jgi:thiol-disulfide isomerase/thioredoxin
MRQSLRLLLGCISVLFIVILTFFLVETLGVFKNYRFLDWVPILSCIVAYAIAGLITKRVNIKFLPVLLVSLYIYIVFSHEDLIWVLLISAIGTLLIIRTEFLSRVYRVSISCILVLIFSFYLFSQPLVVLDYEWVNRDGIKIKKIKGEVELWNFGNSNERLPKFEFADVSDNKAFLDEFAHKNMIITYWATWCKPCLEDKPALEKIKADFKDRDDIVFVDVSIDSEKEKWKHYINKTQPTGIQLYSLENQKKIFSTFGCSGIPFTVVVHSSGKFKASNFYRPGVTDFIKELETLN